jgi:hypothetical protein
VLERIFMFVLSLIAPGMLIHAFHMRSRVGASQSWPSVTGRITRSKIEKGKENDHILALEYGYSVNGVPYTGKRVGFGASWNVPEKLAETESGRYRPDTAVTVYFNPKKPSDAVLLREAQGLRWWFLGGGLMCVISVVIWYVLITGGDFPDVTVN